MLNYFNLWIKGTNKVIIVIYVFNQVLHKNVLWEGSFSRYTLGQYHVYSSIKTKVFKLHFGVHYNKRERAASATKIEGEWMDKLVYGDTKISMDFKFAILFWTHQSDGENFSELQL